VHNYVLITVQPNINGLATAIFYSAAISLQLVMTFSAKLIEEGRGGEALLGSENGKGLNF
jgi:hypothetical protein